MKVYMVVTNDRYELPIAIEDSYSKLSKLTGMHKYVLNKSVKEGVPINKKKWLCREVEIK